MVEFAAQALGMWRLLAEVVGEVGGVVIFSLDISSLTCHTMYCGWEATTNGEM